MSLGAIFLARAAKLPRGRFRVKRTRNVRVPTRDGVSLETELFEPRNGVASPTLLMRLPYGIRGFSTVAELYAGHGYNVVVQSCRGTGRSGGEFDPLGHERDDGLDTLEWIKVQPWYDGRLGLSGPSYLGYAVWSISDALPRQSALAVKVSSAEFKSVVFPNGGFGLGLWLNWIQVVLDLRRGPFKLIRDITTGGIDKRTLNVSMKLPLMDADRRLTGRDLPFWRRWLDGSIDDDGTFWSPLDHTHRLGIRTPPTTLTTGWYDLMLDQLLRDYETLADAGVKPQLTVGPWFHISEELHYDSIRETLDWMDQHLLGRAPATVRRPVRLFIMGRDEWREFEAYPPGTPDTQIWHLHPEGIVSMRPVSTSEPDRYRYDPADPTPSIGGAIFGFTGAGPVDQAPLEKRIDVLTYSSEPLFSDLTIIGNVRAVIYARASSPNADLFVKLCDVDENGRSTNICDGYVHKTTGDPAVPDDIWRLNFKLHATAHTFLRGHRLRLIVCSGAHPRYARNTGTDEPFGTAITLVPVDIEVFHDPKYPSAIHLPVHEL